jgi:hypothetical protein
MKRFESWRAARARRVGGPPAERLDSVLTR